LNDTGFYFMLDENVFYLFFIAGDKDLAIFFAL